MSTTCYLHVGWETGARQPQQRHYCLGQVLGKVCGGGEGRGWGLVGLGAKDSGERPVRLRRHGTFCGLVRLQSA